MTDEQPVKCKKCNGKVVMVIDRYEDGKEIQRMNCLSCNSTFEIILGRKL